MAQTTLGLDIGQYAIKGVRIAQTLRGLRLIDSFERKLPLQEAKEVARDFLGEPQIEELKRLISEGKVKPGERIAVSLPGHLVSTREITLPFSDPKRLGQLVPFEVEGQLPFDLEEVAIDYQLLDIERPGAERPIERPGAERPIDRSLPSAPQSRLLVSALPKELLRRCLARLQSLGLDPAWVGIDSISLYTFYQYFSESLSLERERLLLIDAGGSKTTLCYLQGKTLRWVRTFPMGGDSWTEAIQREFRLSWEEAEKLKEEIDLGSTERVPYQERGVGRMKEAIAPWLREIEMSLRREEGGSPSAFYLCGGGAGLRGLREMISERLQAEPVSLEWASLAGKSAPLAGMETTDMGLLRRRFVQAIGSALASVQNSGLNFRKGEFVFGKETIERRNKFISIGLVFLLLLGLMAGDLYLRYHQRVRRYQDLKRELRAAFTQAFPETKNILNEVEQTRSAIGDLRRTAAFLGVGEEGPLRTLKEVTAAVPKEIQIDVQEFVIDGNKIRIEAQTDSYESVDRIRGGLLKSPRFQEVNVGDAKVSADQSKVNFRIQMSIVERKKDERKGPS